jgi:hypothetical protein
LSTPRGESDQRTFSCDQTYIPLGQAAQATSKQSLDKQGYNGNRIRCQGCTRQLGMGWPPRLGLVDMMIPWDWLCFLSASWLRAGISTCAGSTPAIL